MAGEDIASERIEESFSSVADKTRISILQAIWEGKENPMSFSAIRKASGVDDSGQFNYHLGKLRPEFVRKRNEGYELTSAGQKMIGAAVSGTYTDRDVDIDPIEVGECPNCPGELEATYENEYIRIECPECELTITEGLTAPPVLASNIEPEELPQVFSRLLITKAQMMNRGFCLLCGGHMERSLKRDGGDSGDVTSDHLTVLIECRSCGHATTQVVGVAILDHPAVVSFLYDHGIDVRETPIWEFDWMAEPHAEVANEDPIRIETAIEIDEDRLELTLDETLSVTEYRQD